MSNTTFFPQTQAKSNGAGFAEQNRKCSTFTGKISAIRPIKSDKNPTVFGVIEITVDGEPGVFQDYLNFNPNKAQESMSFLVSHCKSAIISTGNEVINPDEEKDMAWVERSYRQIVDQNLSVTFNQSQNNRGQLNITYLAPQQNNMGW